LPNLPLQNASTTLQAIFVLQKQLPISKEEIIQGLQRTTLAGRMQKIAAPITTIVDVTHNPHAAELLAQHLRAISPQPKHWHAVVGMLKDKDIQGTLAPLVPLIQSWYFASLKVERGAEAAVLEQALRSLNGKAQGLFEAPHLAYRAALTQSTASDALIVFGSFYTVADVLKFAP
jgi:dihydrofolate synthase/folylpolyglutamate synthase